MQQSHKPESWELVALILERVVSNLESARAASKKGSSGPALVTRFDSSRVPGITIRDYVARIHQYADCSESCYTLAFVYIDRLLQKNPSFVLSMKSIHRLLLTSMVLAIKYSDDIYADNGVYAKIGGVSLIEANCLEAEMLAMLQFELYVSPQLYEQYTTELAAHYAQIRAQELEQAVAQEMVVDCPEETCEKPIQQSASMGSICTVPSTNDMAEA